MDDLKYQTLRERLRQRATRMQTDIRFLMDFAQAVEYRANAILSREKKVCTAGSMTGTEFVAGQYEVTGSAVGFTLQVEFHDRKGTRIHSEHVHFVSKCLPGSFVVHCTTTGEEVEQTSEEALTENGQRAVVNMLDKALTEAVDKVLGE